MARRFGFALLMVLAAFSCSREEPLQPLSEYESAEVQARTFNFQVYPGSRFLPAQTELLRRAHFVMHPEAKEAPPMAIYETDASVDEVAAWYASKYGYPEIASSDAPAEGGTKPQAWYSSGDLRAGVEAIRPILAKLEMNTDMQNAAGEYRGANISPQATMPRVTIQRPYYDVLDRQIVERTLVVMVRE